MDGKLTCKDRLVEGGHKTESTSFITYYSVVTRESVRLLCLIACLNNLDICAYNIGNTYLNYPCGEKLLTESGS